MSKNLVIVESPAKAKTISRFLGKEYKVLASMGHVMDLPKSKMGIETDKDFQPKLEKALRNVIEKGLTKELETWDGCFIIRQKRGLSSLSIHSWANAIDLNASENQLNQTPKLSKEFVKCFTDTGMDWGGIWERRDGMHFQNSQI